MIATTNLAETRGADDERDRDSSTLKVVDTVLDVLLFLSHSGEETGVRELARAVNIPRTSAARILTTLKRRGFLVQSDATLQYRLGPRILELAAAYRRSVELRRIALPDMNALAAATGESVFLGVLDDADVVILERVDGPNPLRMMTEPGAREPLYCTGLGKVLLAGMPEARRATLVGGLVLERKTERTIASPGALLDAAEKVAAEGFAFDDEEFQPGAACIAAPIREFGGGVVAAISISGPSFRMAAHRKDDLIRLVGEAGRSVSRKIGFEIEKSDDFLDRPG